MFEPMDHSRRLWLTGLLALAAAGCGSSDGTATPSSIVPASPAVPTATAVGPTALPTTSPAAPTAPPTLADRPRNPAPIGDGAAYSPIFDPSDFVEVVDHPYWPLAPGTSYVFEGGGERIQVDVLPERRTVMGVSTVVVRDQVFADRKLIEDTLDWYAQDSAGNVWYFGEDTTSYEDDPAGDHAGSWEAGVDGALPGVVMLADPHEGDVYRQEYLGGEAEDLALVRHVEPSRTVKAGTFDDILVTEEWTPLDPGAIELKYYARGIGFIAERTILGGRGSIELVLVTTGTN